MSFAVFGNIFYHSFVWDYAGCLRNRQLILKHFLFQRWHMTFAYIKGKVAISVANCHESVTCRHQLAWHLVSNPRRTLYSLDTKV